MSRENKKKILVVTSIFPTWSSNSLGLFVYELSKRLVDSFDLIVLAPHTKGAKTRERLGGLVVYRFKYFWPVSWQKLCYHSGILANLRRNKLLLFTVPFLLISQFFRTIYLIRKKDIDLVHAHWFFPSGLIAGLAGKICRKQVVITAHGSDIFSLKGWFWNKVKKIIISLADAVSVVSPEIEKKLVKLKIGKIFIVPMGVDVSLFKFKPKEKQEKRNQIRLLFVGRLNIAKGIDYLIKALPVIISKFPETKLTIVGLGQEKSKFEKLADKLNLMQNVDFLGGVANQELPKYYQEADIFVLPSLTEGTPVTVLEAMSCGCPVVATKVGGLPSLIKDKKNGLLVKSQSSVEISRAIIKILSENDLRDKIIKEAQKTIEEGYSWPIIIKSFKGIYKSCLNE